MNFFWLILIAVMIYVAYISYKQLRFILILLQGAKQGKYTFCPQGKLWWMEKSALPQSNFFIITDSEVFSVKILTFYAPWHNAVVFNDEGDYRKIHILESKDKKKKLSLNGINFRKGLPIQYFSKKVTPLVLFYPAPRVIFKNNKGKNVVIPNGDKMGNCIFCGFKKFRLIIQGEAYE